ncbi:MAG: selenium cofactor biosynthesis protein YqeC [Ilumatobacteraceae bacterium]
MPIPLGRLARAMDLNEREHIAVVGGGGKTTTVLALGQQLPGRRILTTTTKMGVRQHGGFAVLTKPERQDLVNGLTGGAVMVRQAERGSKAIGVDPAVCDHWFADRSLCEHIIIEADGARTRPFKAPAPYEPVIPATTTIVVSVIGADALGRVIADQCHRPLRVAALAGCSPYERLTPERAARVICDVDGGGRNVPAAARRMVLVTKVPDYRADPVTAELVDGLLEELAGRIETLAVELEGDR